MKTYDIVTIPGDGIGPEIMEASIQVLKAVQTDRFGFNMVSHDIGAGRFQRTGEILPESVIRDCKQSHANLLSAIGLPHVRLDDGTEVQPQMVVGLRKALDLYAAVRPIKLYPGIKSPLGDTSDGIDFVVLRENSEGLFASFNGGATVEGEAVADTILITRRGTARIAEFAFQLARKRKGRLSDGKPLVTCVDKANVFRSLAFFRSIFDEVAANHSDVAHEHALVDAMCVRMVQTPSSLDVLVMENMFGDILSDLAAGLVGGLGVAPSAEIGDSNTLFQPSHGSAPDIAGKNIANPIAMILSAVMMLEWLGHEHQDTNLKQAAQKIEYAVEQVLLKGEVRTPDLSGGTHSTMDLADAVIAHL